MSEEAPTLKWGDIIRIHGVNLSKENEENTKGLIVSKGYYQHICIDLQILISIIKNTMILKM